MDIAVSLGQTESFIQLVYRQHSKLELIGK